MDDWKSGKTIDVEPGEVKYVDRPQNNPMTKGQPGQPGQPGMGADRMVENAANAGQRGAWALFFGIASIVAGICLGGAPWIGVLSGTAAIILSAVEKKRKNPVTKKISTAALACGIVGVCLSIFVGVVLWFIVMLMRLSSPAWTAF